MWTAYFERLNGINRRGEEVILRLHEEAYRASDDRKRNALYRGFTESMLKRLAEHTDAAWDELRATAERALG
jgi:hypothetical protein